MMKFISLIFMILSCQNALAFKVTELVVNCLEGSNCNELKESFTSLERTFSSKEHFYNVFKIYVANEGVKELTFDYTDGVLTINTRQKKRIGEINTAVISKHYDLEIPPMLPVKEGEFIDSQKVTVTKNLIAEIAKDSGFPNAQVEYKIKNESNSVDINFKIKLGKPIFVRDITTNAKTELINEYIKKKIYYNINKPFNPQQLKTEMESLKELFVDYGYYLFDFEMRYRFLDDNSVSLYLDVKSEKKYAFYFQGNKFLDTMLLKTELANHLITSRREIVSENLIKHVRKLYMDKGYLNTDISLESINKNSKKDNSVHIYKFLIKENMRESISAIRYKGNNFFSHEDLMKMYEEVSSEQARRGIYDEKNYDIFAKFLRDKYIENGFVGILIENPIIQYDLRNNRPNILFKIREGVRSKVDRIDFIGVTDDVKKLFLGQMENKPTESFNPIAFKSDLDKIQNMIQNMGYFYGKIVNLRDSDLVAYKLDNSRVDIKLKIVLGDKIYADDIIILGNTFTRKILIKREIEFKNGDLITSDKLERSKSNLLRLGLFSSVQIKPVSQGYKSTDILIFVREKDFGAVELAPGVRTDIGFKLSTTVTYNNIDGMNKKITWNGSVNKRFDLTTLDEQRRKNSSSLWEFDTTINYSENHIFHSDVDFDMSIGKIRRRFFTFDADIQRVGYGISYNLTNWLNFSARQQVETISQFEATFEKDDGHFQIGSFTPAVLMDFRNRSVNPTKGTLHELSCEFANPFFFSQKNDELTIDYYKLVSRNKFYVPISSDFTLAMSGTFGIQENKANDITADGSTQGYIPNIKVFRLVGTDQVRGFDDSEINVLDTGQDISEVEVNTRAYMVNLKFEPRYSLSDSTILGVFYDAGRLFVNEVDMDDLRSSVGLSFKYITPVGTLDFDYGIKLLRKQDSSGRLESPGRLHVSIGFF